MIDQPAAGWIFGYSEDIEKAWCIYHHYIPHETTGEPYLIYIGVCRLTAVYTLAEAKRNSEWQKLVKPSTNLHIRIVQTGGRIECLNAHAAIRERPICNRIGGDTFASVAKVTCVETNITYACAADACRALDIATSSMSNHLQRKPGHRTIKGMTFRKGN